MGRTGKYHLKFPWLLLYNTKVIIAMQMTLKSLEVPFFNVLSYLFLLLAATHIHHVYPINVFVDKKAMIRNRYNRIRHPAPNTKWERDTYN